MFSFPAMNLIDTVIDEVALEGLDGITLEALWQRLSLRLRYSLPLSKSFMEQVWLICLKVKDFVFYELESPRDKLVIFDRYEFVDPDLGTILEPVNVPKDIYPHCPIDDVNSNIKGSCATYYTRQNVNDVVKTLNLYETEEKYGQKLVIVASQALREHALMGNSVCPALELSIMQYCFLERVGRARYHGEVTQGKLSLSLLKEDPKFLFYHRKFLLRHKLITKQIHHQKSSSGHGCSGSLLHLPKFFVERKPKMIFLAEQVIEILKSKNNYVAEYDEIRKELQIENSIRKLFKTSFFQKVVKTDLRVPYRTLYPNAEDREWQQKNDLTKEKTIRVVQLLNSNIDISEIWGKDEVHDDDDMFELDISEQKINLPLLKQANSIVEASGRDGLSQGELAKKMGLTKLQSRTILRNLVKIKIVATYMNDVGRQRVTKYVPKKFEKSSTMSKQFQKEMYKIKELTKTASTENKEKSIERDINSSNIAPVTEAEVHSLNDETKIEVDDTISLTSRKADVTDICQKSNDKDDKTFYTTNRILCKYKLTKSRHKYKYTFLNLTQMHSQRSKKNLIDKLITNKQRKTIANLHAFDRAKALTLFNSIETKLVEQKSIRLGKSFNEVVGIMEDLQINEKKNISNITYRLLRRANMIIEAVKEHKVIDDITKLMKMINEEEDREGYVVKIDKRSLIRLLQKLAKDNLVKNIKLTLSARGKDKSLTFICDPSIGIDHTVIKSAMEQAKLKFCLLGSRKVKAVSQNPSEEFDAGKIRLGKLDKGLEAFKTKKSKSTIDNPKYDSKAGRRYGFSPKFIRMQTLHTFLYYLIYDHPGEQFTSKNEQIATLRRSNFLIDDKLEEEMNTVYTMQVGWKMFIPPLPRHNGWPLGWTLMCDVLLRIPLSVFLKVHNVPYVIPDLEQYINHPIKKHFLVKDLPSHVRNTLLISRKYIFSIHETITRLCYIGLVQFGPQKLKEKDQVFIYLNRHSELMDTTSSAAGYHKIEDKPYPIMKYTFDSMQTVEKYWYDMWNTCINTYLGGRLVVQGKEILLEDLAKKTEMIQSIKAHAPEEVVSLDVGFVPGDRKGAAGIDSAFFAHLKRNWNWSNACYMHQHYNNKGEKKNKIEKQRHAYLSKVKARPLKFTEFVGLKKVTDPATVSAMDLRKRLHQRVKTSDEYTDNKRPKYQTLVSYHTAKQKSFVRRVLPRKRKVRPRVKYDEVDFCALQQMDKLRVDWEPHEDNILLVCKVAMMYLCPNPRKQLITFTAVRDVLRSYSASSFNKTSRACQRRLLYMLRRSQTTNSVALGVEEIKQNFYINKRFGGIVEKVKKECQDLYEYEERVAQAFKELVAYIAKKYYDISDMEPRDPIIVPKTIQEFNLLYKLKRIAKSLNAQDFAKDIRDTDDIHSATIRSVIHSSMCCGKDRTSWAYQLFRVYQQYPEVLLRTAMTKVRADQIVSVKKNYMRAMKKYGNCMPMSSSQYQLSTSYVYKFQTKWPYETFSESYDLLCKLTQWHCENQLKELNYAVPSNKVGVEAVPVTGGIVVGIHDYFAKGQLEFDIEIPDQIIMLDPRLQEKDETYLRIAQKYQDILTGLDQLNLKQRRSAGIDLIDPEVEEEDEMERREFEDKVIKEKREKEDRDRLNYWKSRNDGFGKRLEETEIKQLRDAEDRERRRKRENFDNEMIERKKKYLQVLELGAENVPEAIVLEFQNPEDSKGDIDLDGFDSDQEENYNVDDDDDENHTIRFQDGTTITLSKEDIERSTSDMDDDDSGSENKEKKSNFKQSKHLLNQLKSNIVDTKLNENVESGFDLYTTSSLDSDTFSTDDALVIHNDQQVQKVTLPDFKTETRVSFKNSEISNTSPSKKRTASVLENAEISEDVAMKRIKMDNSITAELQTSQRINDKCSSMDTSVDPIKEPILNKDIIDTTDTITVDTHCLPITDKESNQNISSDGNNQIVNSSKDHDCTIKSKSVRSIVKSQHSSKSDNHLSESSSSPSSSFTRVNDIIKNVYCEMECENRYNKTEDLNDIQKRCTRIDLLMMREELNDLALSDSHHAHEYFVVNMFKIFYSLQLPNNEELRTLKTFQDYEVPAEILPLNVNLAKQLIDEVKKFALFPKEHISYTKFKLDVVEHSQIPWNNIDMIYKFVRDKKEIGATLTQLTVKFNDMSEKVVYDVLSLLTESRLFLRSGIKAVHYIHWRYTDPWLIHSYKIFRLEKESQPVIPKGSMYFINDEKEQNTIFNIQSSIDTDKCTTVSNSDEVSDKNSCSLQSNKDENKASVTNVISNSNLNEEMKITTNKVQKRKRNKSESSDNEEEHDSYVGRRMRRKRTSLLQQKDIQKAAKRLDFNTAEEIKVVIKPWIRIDGVLNRRVLDRMLGAVLTHCIMHPGITLVKVQYRFMPALQPFHTRELVEMLVKLECLKMKVLKKSRTTLFSKPSPVKLGTAKGLELEDEIIIESAIDATLKFGMFVGNKTYGSDFLS